MFQGNGKVALRSAIGYFIGYDSTHIFRIWIPQKRKIIRPREAVIDENLRCNPNDPYIEDLLQNTVPRKQVVLDIPDFRSRSIRLPYGIDETSSEEDSDNGWI